MSPFASSDLPRNNTGRIYSLKRNVPLFGLAPSGVYLATTVTGCAVRYYHTISPLPNHLSIQARIRRYIFCCTSRRLSPPRSYLALYPLESGLSSAMYKHNRDCLTISHPLYILYIILSSVSTPYHKPYSYLSLTKQRQPLLLFYR